MDAAGKGVEKRSRKNLVGSSGRLFSFMSL